MNKKSIIFVVLISLFSVSFSIYQYVREFKADLVGAAYSSTKPANGHTWSEMECSSTLCLTGGNTGLGTSTPAYKLDVQGGQINASGGLCIAGDCKTSWSSMGGVWTTSSTNIYNSNTGNVGIGTSTPGYKLEVAGEVASVGPNKGFRVRWTNGNDVNSAPWGGLGESSVILPGSTDNAVQLAGWGGLHLITASGNISMTQSGNVGIGTTSPSQKLEVNGNIISSGDICNGGGKCLSSIFQTNVIAGTNPTCPSGQTMIMKSYNGTWYTAGNTSITSWSQITCGVVLSSDGTALLVNNTHTSKNCIDAGGTVVSDGTSNMCRFNGASCPNTWTMYNNWSTTVSSACGMNSQGVSCWCTPAVHGWSNEGIASCTAFSGLPGHLVAWLLFLV